MPPIPLQELPLRPSTLSLLQQRGFHTTHELDDSHQHGGISNLAAELDVPLTQAHNLMEEVLGCVAQPLPEILTANDLWQQQQQHRGGKKIVTFSQSIDKMLGGGIDIGQVTEIAGLPGAGKTQLAMQLCVNTCLAKMYGGVQGQAVYVDTEGSLSPERLYALAKALVQHVQSTCRRRDIPFPENFTAEFILDSIHVFRVHDEASQTATLYSLPKFLEQEQSTLPVKLVVIDSIAFHYRSATPNDREYYLQRTQNLTNLASFLGDLATKYQLAVVAINQMTTKVDESTNTSRCVPALGESWAHATTTRLLLTTSSSQHHGSDRPQERTCTLVKSPHKPPGTAQYQVLDIGIRDVRNKTKAPEESSGTTNPTHHHDSNKRLRTH